MPHALCIPPICNASPRRRATMTTRLTLAIQERFDKLSPEQIKAIPALAELRRTIGLA